MSACPTKLNPESGRQVLKEGRVGKRVGKKEGKIELLANGTIRQFYQHLKQPPKDQMTKKPPQFIEVIVDKEGEGDNVYLRETGRKIGKITRGKKPRIEITISTDKQLGKDKLRTTKYAGIYIFGNQREQKSDRMREAFWEKQMKGFPRDIDEDQMEEWLENGLGGEKRLQISKKNARILKKFYNFGTAKIPDSDFKPYI